MLPTPHHTAFEFADRRAPHVNYAAVLEVTENTVKIFRLDDAVHVLVHIYGPDHFGPHAYITDAAILYRKLFKDAIEGADGVTFVHYIDPVTHESLGVG